MFSQGANSRCAQEMQEPAARRCRRAIRGDGLAWRPVPGQPSASASNNAG